MGQQAFGQAALEKILSDGQDEVAAVYCAPDKPGRPVDPLKEYAAECKIPVYQPPDFANEATLGQMRNHQADLMIMAYVTLFVPEAARTIPRLGSICFHPSLLPLHRGPSSINWPIIQGAVKTGFSWFDPTDGLDEGDVLLQWECEIGPDDTLGDVYFKKIFPAAINSLTELCEMYRTGTAFRVQQDESRATYESWCRAKDAEIDWSKPVQEVYNLIRGTNPQPGAWTTCNNQTVKVYDARMIVGSDEEAGVVSEILEDGVVVAARGGAILIKRVRTEGHGKIPASEWIVQAGLRVGDRLGGK